MEARIMEIATYDLLEHCIPHSLTKLPNWKWLLRLLAWIHKKTLGYYVPETITYERHVIDKNDVIQAVIDQVELFMRLNRDKPDYVLLGRPQMDKIVTMRDHQTFGIDIDIPSHGQSVWYRICGIRVIFVPLMDGVFCVSNQMLNGR
jgi:hypothetical protein